MLNMHFTACTKKKILPELLLFGRLVDRIQLPTCHFLLKMSKEAARFDYLNSTRYRLNFINNNYLIILL